ncbi:basic helix-loop-helix (bHLH) DNA-bindingsuperfamily protein, partial [Striga asiatica]
GVIIFQSRSSEYSAKKSIVSCLLPNTPIRNELLDLWSVILNHIETMKTRGSVTCFFASTSPCTELFYDGKRKNNAIYKKFSQTLDSEIASLSSYQLKQIS